MKKNLIIILLLVLSALPVLAQGRGAARSFNERLFDAKVEQIAQTLHMSEDKKARFVPIYREYSMEMIAAWNSLQAARGTDTDQARFEASRREKSLAIRQKYVSRFATVLTQDEIRLFFKVENEIQRRLKQRKQEAQGSAGSRSRR